ncbi:RNA polymerase sigma factor [Pseudogracilibacillus auburnensis]|uniref:RNA polymerase sigma factor n=1 Tax=Pseudogracilibacillus auburnensis TaxID=1494959 RepID=UPI001A9780F6|nr:RNA polymerase sigma factor [Pseudogracilibacillus auburnensis]MBO1003958.1 RNA polymerase sigma factor [Pseudogracilibacillus auburnensis]
MNELEKLYEEIQPKIYAFFYVKTFNSAAAEDLTHDVFYEALKSFSSFSGKSSIQTWLFSIAQNLLKKFYRSNKYKRNLENMLLESDVKHPDTPEDIYITKEKNWNLAFQINQLDALQKEIVTLRVYGELSFKEIGELLDKSENFTRVTFHRAKLKLQKEMRVKYE